MYYFVANSEDGLRVDGPFDYEQTLERINDLTSEDIQPQYRAQFVTTVPDAYTPPEHVLIIEGQFVLPQERQRVTEWTL